MSDFSEVKYKSYVQLCRELRLERHPRQGDRWAYGRERPRFFFWPDNGADPQEYEFWLPTLGDWLEMLEAAGHSDIGFWKEQNWTAGPLPSFDAHGIAPTREEAAARLWLAVTSTKIASTS